MSGPTDPPLPVATVAVAGPQPAVHRLLGALSEIPVLTTHRWRADALGDSDAAWSGFGRLQVEERTLHLVGTDTCDQGEFLRTTLAAGLLGMVLLVDPARPARAGRDLDAFGRIADVPFTVGVLQHPDDPGGQDRPGEGSAAMRTDELFTDVQAPGRLNTAERVPVDPTAPDSARGLLLALLETIRRRLADAGSGPASRTAPVT